MIQVFRTDEEYVKWLDGQTLPSGIVVYVSDDETMYFSTNNIKGELKTYKCEKEEVIQYPPLVYSAKSAGSTITVNGETVTLEQGENITLDYPNEITRVIARNNTALTAITIPNTVVSINDNAFTGCTELTDFRYNGTVEEWGAITLGTDWNKDAAFTVVHCTDGDVTLEEPIQPIQPNNFVYSTNAAGSTIKVNGETVTLEQGENIVLDYPNEITSVKATDNTALTYIQIPNTVTEIESGTYDEAAFGRCTSLISVTLPDSLTSIGNYGFIGCNKLASINIPDGVTMIGNNSFASCKSLGSITLPDSLTSIGNGAFNYCTSLASINIPDGVTMIGNSAFSDCNKLAYINIPNGVKTINANTFDGCAALTSITIPDSVTMIGSGAFRGCNKLASITIPSGVTSIGDWAFNRCSALGSITLPEGITTIKNNTFCDCSSLTSVNIPNTVTSIENGGYGEGALGKCTSLTSVTLSDSLTSIGSFAFYGCTELASITIPNTVTNISNGALFNCARLTEVNYNGTMSQWSSITLGRSWKDNAPFTVVHCTDGDVTL